MSECYVDEGPLLSSSEVSSECLVSFGRQMRFAVYPSAELNYTYKPECKLCIDFLRLICLEGFGETEFQNVDLDRNNLESFHLQYSSLQNKYQKGKYYTKITIFNSMEFLHFYLTLLLKQYSSTNSKTDEYGNTSWNNIKVLTFTDDVATLSKENEGGMKELTTEIFVRKPKKRV